MAGRAKHALGFFKSRLLTIVAESVAEFAKDVAAMPPAISTFISKKVYIKTATKKQLLE